jgi:hypothetical protein
MAAPSPVAQASASGLAFVVAGLQTGAFSGFVISTRAPLFLRARGIKARFELYATGSMFRRPEGPTYPKGLKPSSLASRKRPHQTNHKQHQNGSRQDYNNHGRTLQRTFYTQPSGQSSSLYFQRVTGRPYLPCGSKSTHLSPISLDISLVPELRLGPARLPKKAKTRDNPGIPASCFTQNLKLTTENSPQLLLK